MGPGALEMTGPVAASQLPLRYREDIDWLRAIAVLSVVAFHCEMPAVFGGFVGVDVFFVISGYLITGIVQSELRSGTFSFRRFYERRLRRLLPALYVVVVLTAIPSFQYMLTFERSEFFRSVVAVVTFTSNFFFWYQTGYFDHAAVEKPLLHTWSLAVEEQFYLALPLLLLILSRAVRRGRYTQPLVLGTLATGSFALSLWLMHTSRSAEAFFMSIPRAWEFLVGGVLATPGLRVLRKDQRSKSHEELGSSSSQSRYSHFVKARASPVSTPFRPALARLYSSGAASTRPRGNVADIRR
jgi:peptidoglycan/LPS O-acetylase OafA/YrhL